MQLSVSTYYYVTGTVAGVVGVIGAIVKYSFIIVRFFITLDNKVESLLTNHIPHIQRRLDIIEWTLAKQERPIPNEPRENPPGDPRGD